MNSQSGDSFDRVFPRRSLFAGGGLWCWICSVLGSVCFAALLFDVYLVVDLLATGGETDRQSLDRIVPPSTEGPTAPSVSPNPLERVPNKGLVGTAAWSLSKPWGRPLAAVVRRSTWLQTDHEALVVLAAVGAGLVAACGFFHAQARGAALQASLDVATDLRRSLHRQSLRLGPGELEEAADEALEGLFGVELERVREGIGRWMRHLCIDPVLLAVLLATALLTSWRTTIQCVLPLGLCWWLVQRGQRRFAATRDLGEARAESELKILAESFRKTRLVRSYGMEEFEHARYGTHLERFRDKLLAAERSDLLWRWISRSLVAVFVGLVAVVIGGQVLGRPEDLSLAAAVLLVAALGSMYRPLAGVWRIPEIRAATAQAADRIFRYLQRAPNVAQTVGAKFLDPLARDLLFEDVHCTDARRRPLLQGLDLRIPAGGTTALLSVDPREALSAAYLVPRFVEPVSGRVLIDGEDIAWVTLESLRAEAVFVGGNDPFFTGSVAENISCGSDRFTRQQVTEAAKLVHAHGFVLKLPQGYETVLGEHGETLDPGQAFRIGLARAVLRKPALLIVQEPDALLDDDTRQLLDDTYDRIGQDRTLLFLPARLSTVRRCDRICLINQGRLVAEGTHAELVRSSPLYRHWEYLRFNEFRPEVEVVR